MVTRIPRPIPHAQNPQTAPTGRPDLLEPIDAPNPSIPQTSPPKYATPADTLSHTDAGTPVLPPPASAGGMVEEQTQINRDDTLIVLLQELVKRKGSDLHILANCPPRIRLDGELVTLDGWSRLTADQTQTIIHDAITEEQQKKFEEEKELDFAYTLPTGERFRGNAHVAREHVGAVFRAIPMSIVPLSQLGMPPSVTALTTEPRGLILVTGVTGSGKTTTLAGMIDQINRTRPEHIITIEDPIEFVHPQYKSLIRQREVGVDTRSFAAALKHLLRQDPDVILMGELRDLETISTALTAAETGHLVFATLHTQTAHDTVTRIIDVFPPEQQQQVRTQLSNTLRAVICQTLLKRADHKGRVAAAEVMIVNSAIATLIRRGEIHQIPQSIQGGKTLGMQTLNQHLARLVADGTITLEVAEEKTGDINDLLPLVEGARRRIGFDSSAGNFLR